MRTKGIIGVGNPLRGDDGISIAVIEKLKEKKLPSNVEIFDAGSNEMNILHILKNLEKAIIVDAVRLNKKPGSYVFFEPEEVNSIEISRNPHSYNLFEILQISSKLEETPKRIVIMGIQPKKTSMEMGLSKELKEKIPEIVDKLTKKIVEI